jgi:phosphoribosylglycinamide formyltransferase 1
VSAVPIAVLASGGGSNLQALIDHFNGGRSRTARVRLVVSDRAEAGVLARAERAGVPGVVVAMKERGEDDVARELFRVLGEHGIELVALAGYLKLVPAAVCREFRNRMVNIHPALLPAFGGAGMYGRRVHQAVLDARCRVSGVTVHLVDERYDTGPILMQWPVPVLAEDTAERLAERVLKVEHRVYPAALELVAQAIRLGVGVAPFGVREPAAFELTREEAPSEREVRRALGLR